MPGKLCSTREEDFKLGAVLLASVSRNADGTIVLTPALPLGADVIDESYGSAALFRLADERQDCSAWQIVPCTRAIHLHAAAISTGL